MPLGRVKVFQLAKGFRGRAGNVWRIARARVEKALQHAYKGRKEKKRTFRSLWIQRINAGAREHGVCTCLFELGLLHTYCSRRVLMPTLIVWTFAGAIFANDERVAGVQHPA